MSEKLWLVFDIGCLECGASSEAMGLFHTKKEAEIFIDKHKDRDGFVSNEQHSVEIFEVEMPKEVKHE